MFTNRIGGRNFWSTKIDVLKSLCVDKENEMTGMMNSVFLSELEVTRNQHGRQKEKSSISEVRKEYPTNNLSTDKNFQQKRLLIPTDYKEVELISNYIDDMTLIVYSR